MICRARRWLLSSYSRLHEPRVISAVYGLVYIVSLAVGIYNLFDPPRTISEAADNPYLLYLTTGSIAFGGLTGVITILNGKYWQERYSAGFLVGGLTMYWWVSFWLAVSGSGSRWMSLMTTTFAAILVALRYYWIKERPTNPNRDRY